MVLQQAPVLSNMEWSGLITADETIKLCESLKDFKCLVLAPQQEEEDPQETTCLLEEISDQEETQDPEDYEEFSSEEDCNDSFDSKNEFLTFDSDEEDPPPKRAQIPWWFTHEDKDQIKCILEYYNQYLCLEQKCKSRIREPKLFVGRVKRIPVEGGIFTTLDRVDIFRKALVGPGIPLPIDSSVYLLTCWSTEEGIPTSCYQVENKSKFRASCENLPQDPSYLFALPKMQCSNDFEFCSSLQDREITYWVSALGSLQRYWYGEYMSAFLVENPNEDENKIDRL